MSIILSCATKEESAPKFLGSSTAEHPAVNRRVVGSNPTRGAIKLLDEPRKRFVFLYRGSRVLRSQTPRANMSRTLSRAKKGQTRCFFRVWPFLCALVRVATWLDQAVLTTPLSAPTHEKNSNGTEQGLTMSCSYRLSPISPNSSVPPLLPVGAQCSSAAGTTAAFRKWEK